jgi:methionine-rich copper-binding protein CopC
MHGRRIPTALLLALGCLLFAAPQTRADSAPFACIGISPPDSATVTVSPSEVVLTFNAPVDATMTGGYVHNLDNVIVSTGVRIATDDPTKIIISLTPNLPSGWYMIMWNTAMPGADDSIAGMQEFNVA